MWTGFSATRPRPWSAGSFRAAPGSCPNTTRSSCAASSTSSPSGTSRATAAPRVFVHRDYMPRNLMVCEADNPGILDFQDAVHGPVSYDVASLFRDAFISWEEERVLDGTIRYWEKARKARLPVPADFAQFWRDVEWMGVQRHLKVLGIFARLHYRDGKSGYLEDTPRFVAYVRHAAARYAELAPLGTLLDQLDGRQREVRLTF